MKPEDKTLQSVLASLEIEPEVLPFLPELLADIDELGSSTETVIRLLEPLSLPSDTRVLDLGCGKGAACLAVAERFGFGTTGVDAFEPFIRQAEERALEAKMTNLCSFYVADIRDFESLDPLPDIVLYLALGTLFGPIRDAVGLLRTHVRPGGFILIDDGFLKEETGTPPRGYENCTRPDETRRQLISYGDELLQEVLTPPENHERTNRCILELIESRVPAIAAEHPEKRRQILRYLERQREETEILCDHFISAQWLLRKVAKR